jgi:hypothetical protein
MGDDTGAIDCGKEKGAAEIMEIQPCAIKKS